MRGRRDAPDRQTERFSSPVKKVGTSQERPLSGQKSLVSQLRSTAVVFVSRDEGVESEEVKRWLFVFELLVLLLYMVTTVSNEVFVVHIPSLPCFSSP